MVSGRGVRSRGAESIEAVHYCDTDIEFGGLAVGISLGDSLGSQAKASVGRWITFYNNQLPYAAHEDSARRSLFQPDRNRPAGAESSLNHPRNCQAMGVAHGSRARRGWQSSGSQACPLGNDLKCELHEVIVQLQRGLARRLGVSVGYGREYPLVQPLADRDLLRLVPHVHDPEAP